MIAGAQQVIEAARKLERAHTKLMRRGKRILDRQLPQPDPRWGMLHDARQAAMMKVIQAVREIEGHPR